MQPKDEIAAIAKRIREEKGFVAPPLDAAGLVVAYQLSLPEEPLEEILASLGLDQQEIAKVDAMLDLQGSSVYVREGMHDRKKSWGYAHELGHLALPWHRDLLYWCPILRLPPRVQKQFEREADLFAAEVFFHGGMFIEEALDLPFGLEAPKTLANDRYDVSLHAAFMRYAEENPRSCCLLVFRPILLDEPAGQYDLELLYYVRSSRFSGHIPPKQVCHADTEVVPLLTGEAPLGVVEHEVVLGRDNPQVFRANSFYNQYHLFTLIWGKHN